MPVSLIIRNLNVSNCDKLSSKELKVEPDISIDEILTLINKEHNLNKNIELTYRGEVLKRASKLADYLSSSDVKQLSCFMVETKRPQQAKERPKDMDQVALTNHIIPIFRSKSKKIALENILQNKQKLEEILKGIPKMDFVSYAFVQNSDLLRLLADPKKAPKIIQYRPNIYAGVKQVFNEFRETYKKTPSGSNQLLTRASFSIEDSGEEENAQAASGVTQNQLANVLNSINQRQQQQRNQQPGISRDYFQQVMQQVFSQAMGGPPGAGAASAQTASNSRPSTSAEAAQTPAPAEPMDTTSSQPAQTPRSRLTDSELAAKLEKMHELGLWDDELNVRALQVTEGDVEASVSLILEGVDF